MRLDLERLASRNEHGFLELCQFHFTNNKIHSTLETIDICIEENVAT